jgi:membrane-associated protease RseP (regulator of RpoE activity)
MFRCSFVLAALLAGSLPVARGQSVEPPPPGTAKSALALGLSLGSVPDALYDHLRLPNLRRGQGVLIRAIAPDSPAVDSGLQRNDVVLSCNGTPIQDGDQLVRLLQATAPEGKARVLLVRGGKEMRVRLRLGAPEDAALAPPVFPKGLLKPGGPPAITVKAEVLDGGKLQITFAFFSDGKGKLDQVTCSGSLTEIQAQVRELGVNNQIPMRIRELVDVALKRIRTLKEP